MNNTKIKAIIKAELNARDKYWKEKIDKATSTRKNCLCLDKDHCKAEGWNEATEYIRNYLLNNKRVPGARNEIRRK